nr:hypothetical protein [Tanacetum cinerariifolium]
FPSASHSSSWSSIINEVNSLKTQGVDFISHCKIRVGNGMRTIFWHDFWIGDTQLKYLFPRLYALESIKESFVADKLQAHIASSFRRAVRGGVETQQLNHLLDLLGSVILSNMKDRWVWHLNGDGVFVLKMLVTCWTRLFSLKMMCLRVGLSVFRLKSIFLLGRSSLIGSLLVRIYLEEVLRLLFYLARIAMLSSKTRPICFSVVGWRRT